MSSKEKNSKLFIGNLSSRTTKEDLEKLFEPLGKINELKLKEKPGNNYFAFVEYDDIRDAEQALHKLDNTELLGRDLRIEFSHSSSARGRSDRGGGDFKSDYRGKSSSGPKKCYTCGRVGHIAKYCKDSPRRRRSSSRDKYRRRDSRSRDRRRRRSSSGSRSRSRDRRRRSDSRDKRKKRSESRDKRKKRSDSRGEKKNRKKSYSSSRSKSSRSGSKSRSRSKSGKR